MDTTKQQLKTLFGGFVMVDDNCPYCGQKFSYNVTQSYFIDGLTIYCDNCDGPTKANTLKFSPCIDIQA